MADSSGKSAQASAKLNFTPDERALFGRLFRECDPEGSTVVTGESAVRMFQRSRLSEQVLSEIWAMADTENRGFLVQEDFAKSMRLIGQYQANPGIALRPELALSPGPLPKFDGVNLPTAGQAAFPPQGIQAQNSGPIRVPPLTTDRIAEYIKLFDRAGAQNGLLSGDLARMSFERSGQSSEVLASIWNLVDTEQRGSLNLTEFIIAMHLLASYKAKTLTALPPAIPAGLYEAASRRPAQAGLSMRSPTIRPGELGQIPRQASGPGAARGPQARPPAPPAGAAEWAIGPREKTSYDELFDKVDLHRQGFISGEQAVLFFSDSGLPSEILAAIWDLANIRRLDQLNRDEFAVAMYLIRNQRGKSQPDLPSELPSNLIPPSLRPMMQPQATGLPFGQAAAPAPAPAPQKSNAEDLFGLDALTSSPSAPVKEQTTGGSGAINRSADIDPFAPAPTSPSSSQQFSARGNSNTFFKSFAPTSSFGQTIVSQNTGASTGSAPSVSKAPGMDDLLGDADPEVSKKLTKETADLGNMSNQIGMLRTQMQAVQTKKGAAESQLATNSSQKRDMEARLQQFRSQYEQEVKTLKLLEDQLASERNDVSRLNQQLAMVQATYQDVQNRHREASTNLENTKRENAGLKDRLRQMNEYISQTKPEVEKLQSDHRQQKGLVAIQRKQAEKLEEEKAQLERMKTELAESQRDQTGRPAASPEITASSAVSGSSSTNPFMRRSPQSSMDNTMSPSGFSRTVSGENNKFNDIFHSAFSTPAATNVPPTSFHNAFAHPGSSVKSSEPDMPTPPSTSPPLSAYQESPQVPIPPTSRQLTSKDLPFGDKSRDSESMATSVRVESPMSRYDFSTPTNATSSPHASSAQGTEGARAGTTGASMFERNIPTSSPVASVKSEASKQFGKDSGPFAGPSGSGLEPNNSGTSAFTDRNKETVKSEATSASRTDPFSFASNQTASGGKGDFEAAFASIGRSDPGPNGTSNDPLEKFNSEFPPIKDEFPGAKPAGKDEFPPIKERDVDDESESDAGGFDDDFTKASPKPKTTGREGDRGFGASQAFDSPFQSFSPAGPDHPSTSGGDFGAPPAPSGTKEADKTFGAPSSASQGEALFGGPKGPTNAASSMFSTSPPETNRTSNRSDTYQSAVSHQSSTDNAFSPIEPQPSQGATTSAKPAGQSAFDFDHGFDDLDDAKEGDDHDDEDLMGFGPSHAPEHDFNPMFDAPLSAKDRTPTGPGKHAFPEDHFGDFESSFSGPKSSSAQGATTKPTPTSAPHDWDAMMKGIDVDSKAAGHPGPMPPPPASSSPAAGKLPAGMSGVSTKDFDDLGPGFPEAPEPPRLGPAISAGMEHDDPILKRLTSMGYPRPIALAALEKYDYDLDKATDYLASPK